VPDGTGLLIHIRAVLDGSYTPAQELYATYVQEYAEQLASESARQEASARELGAKAIEITESAVIRARESLNKRTAEQQLAAQPIKRQPLGIWEAAALAGAPMFSAATGVTGSYLHSLLQWVLFSLSALAGVICILYLLKRRLL
jgi:hypothetical protein